MILDKDIEIIVNNQQLEYYKNLGYNAEYRNPLRIKPTDLVIGSHYKINVQCDICSGKTIVEYRQLKGVENYLCSSCAAKNKKMKIYSVEEKKKISEKIRKSLENKKLENQNFWTEHSEKRKITKLSKYGDENYNNQELKKETLKEKYGYENYNNNLKRKETLKEKYGDENFNNQKKKERTCLNRYGVRHTNHIPIIMHKIQKSAMKIKYHNNTKLYYRGTYEKHFLDFCFDNNITIESFKGNITYWVENKEHKYYPDFFHVDTNTIIEIKSTYTFEKNYKINKLKEKYSKERYKFLFIIDKNYNDFLSFIK